MKSVFARLRAQRLGPHVLASLGAMAFGLASIVVAPPVSAQAIPAGYGAPMVVRNDLGGDVGVRANRIAAMAAAGQSVEIRGAVCYSACTMYLGLPGSCVSRTTQFGFHGPSYYGMSLPPEQFEYWSQVIAAHYPPALRAWFLRDARYHGDMQRLLGADLIRMGVPECG